MSEDAQIDLNTTPGAEDTPKPTPRERRERAACDALRTLVRDFVAEEIGAPSLEGRPLELALQVRVRLDPAKAWDLQFEPSLSEQLADQCQDAVAEWGVFQPGRVFCFRCRSQSCEHAVPASPLEVFSGYAATGAPRWHELSQAFIDAKDERVDALFAEPPQVAARVSRGHDLKGEQLSSFGRSSKTYALLGQVMAGYFQLDTSRRGRDGSRPRLAITYQVVETRDKGGHFVLRLNPVCCIPGGALLEELFASGWEPWVERAQAHAVVALARIEKHVLAARARRDNKGINEALKGVLDVLRRLAVSLERGYRQRRRRTRHAEERRAQRRPVHMAMADTRRARSEAFLSDERTDTVVVSGDQGRIHVFTRTGRHVTSFVGAPNIVEFRLRTHRWRMLEDNERSGFLEEFERASGPARA